jgi:hypothetical protein
MAEFTWKFSEREKWFGRHPSLWFSVGRDSHRSAKGGYPEITISSFDVFYKKVEILLGGCLTVKNQWRLSTAD